MMPTRAFHARVVLGLVAAGFAALSSGCDSCGSDTPPLATLMAAQGSVSRDHHDAVGKWSVTEPGAEFVAGDGLRTGGDSKALLAFAGGAQLAVEPDTQIRLVPGDQPGQLRIDIVTGSAVLRTGNGPFHLLTQIGSAVLRGGTELRLARVGDAVLYRLELGSAVFRNASGEQVEVGKGSEYEIGIGSAVLRRAGIGDAELRLRDAGGADGGDDAGAGDAGDAGDAEVSDAGANPEVEPEAEELTQGEPLTKKALGTESLARGELQLLAGASVTVHAPEMPITVSLDTSQACSGVAVVELTKRKKRFNGTGSVSIELKAGWQRYAVKCVIGDKLQMRGRVRGSIRVLRDTGTRTLPLKAPTNRVEADGRTYSLLYQNHLPRVVINWPRHPSSSEYTVNVDGKPRKVKTAEVRLGSGELPEGTHKIYFEAEGRRSRTATVEVDFDNAAAAASLSAPVDRSFAPGAGVPVQGVALPGWTVSAERGTIEMDERHRFKGTASTSAENPEVVLRLTHPGHGVHYYLRRPAR